MTAVLVHFAERLLSKRQVYQDSTVNATGRFQKQNMAIVPDVPEAAPEMCMQM